MSSVPPYPYSAWFPLHMSEAEAEQARVIISGINGMISRGQSSFTMERAVTNQMRGMLDAWFGNIVSIIDDSRGQIAFHLESIDAGLQKLGSRFSVFAADVLWRLQLQHETTKTLTEAVQNPLATEARELFRRGHEAFKHDLFDDAVADLLEAEKKNRYDFNVHRTLAQIYYVHLKEPEKALDYYKKTYRYAANKAPSTAADAHFWAAKACSDLGHFQEAIDECNAALALSPDLNEARFQLIKCNTALAPGKDLAADLEDLIKRDPAFYTTIKKDGVLSAWLGNIELKTRLAIPDLRTKVAAKAETLTLPPALESEANLLLGQLASSDHSVQVLASLEAGRFLSKLDKEQGRFHHVFTLKGGHKHPSGIAWDPSGQFLASADFESFRDALKVWNIREGKLVLGLGRHLHSVAFSRQGGILATAGRAGGEINLWNTATWTGLGSFPRLKESLDGNFQCLTFHRQDRLLAAGTGPDGGWTVLVWDLETRQEIKRFEAGFAAFSPTQNLLAITDTGVQLLNTATWEVTQRLTGNEELFHYQGRGYPVALRSLAFSPDGAFLATGALNKACVWDVRTCQVIHDLPDYEGSKFSIHTLAFSPNGSLLAYKAATKPTVKILQVRNPNWDEIELPDGEHERTAFAFGQSDGATMLALGTEDGTVEIWRRGFPQKGRT
jgi:WD40 repeat protein